MRGSMDLQAARLFQLGQSAALERDRDKAVLLVSRTPSKPADNSYLPAEQRHLLHFRRRRAGAVKSRAPPPDLPLPTQAVLRLN